jgi:hypothetical protein
MAGALSVIVWRMLRDEKQRADSRVAALTTLAAAAPEQAKRTEPIAPRRDLDLHIHDSAHVAPKPRSSEGGPGGLFVERHEASPWGQRAVVMTALALIGASTILFTLASSNRATDRPAARFAPAVPQASPVSAPVQAGLELVSLRDARDNGALTITGLVHNPPPGATSSSWRSKRRDSRPA